MRKKYSNIALLLLISAIANAGITLNFYAITDNYPGNPAIGEKNFFVDVDQFSATQTSFKIYNTGPEIATITNIYFDDYDSSPSLGAIYVINNGPGVSYEPDSKPGNLPAGNNATPAFEKPADLEFAPIKSNGGVSTGIDPGEYVTLVFNNGAGLNFNDLVSYISNDQLRLGIHAQSFGINDTSSEAFVTYYNPVPTPSAIMLGAIGTGLVTYLRRNKLLA